MQMIWLSGAAVPAKKVHFNLNRSELRGFPIKARSGQSGILYANLLAPERWAVAASVLLLLPEAKALPAAVCQIGPTQCHLALHFLSQHISKHAQGETTLVQLDCKSSVSSNHVSGSWI